MEITIQLYATMQPLVTSPSAVSQHSSVDLQIMDWFALMKMMLSSFLGPRQETTGTAFCNYLASEVAALEDKDFLTFKNEAVKLLHSIQSRAEGRSFCATNISTNSSCQRTHLNHPRHSDASKPGHPTSSSKPSGNQRTAATKIATDFLHSC